MDRSNFHLFFSYFRFGQAGNALCAGQESGDQNCQQGETQRERPTKGTIN